MSEVERMEQVIRDMAANVVSLWATRKSHPTYGVSKAQIRKAADRMDGAIGMYMIMVGQSRNFAVAPTATFLDGWTGERVSQARRAITELEAQ